MEIELITTAQAISPMTTRCGPTLQRLLEQHGQDHVVIVLKTFTETTGNADAMIEQAILAVSSVVRAHPSWPEQVSLWLECFDSIALRELVALAKPLKPAGELARSAIAGMLVQRLKPIFEPPKPKPERQKSSEPEPRREDGAVKAIEQGLILLQHKGGHKNSRIGHVARQLGLLRSEEPSQRMRAAKLYAHRLDLVRFLPQAVLFKLASPKLPQPIREEAERILAAGGKLTGAMVDTMARRARA
ncbi:hypothetical protein C7G41_17175 [Bradyrhizobium sp. MOS002]|nr:hypothetical protein C7G41_17175 [Bradyrhizobium sp. MOS002]